MAHDARASFGPPFAGCGCGRCPEDYQGGSRCPSSPSCASRASWLQARGRWLASWARGSTARRTRSSSRLRGAKAVRLRTQVLGSCLTSSRIGDRRWGEMLPRQAGEIPTYGFLKLPAPEPGPDHDATAAGVGPVDMEEVPEPSRASATFLKRRAALLPASALSERSSRRACSDGSVLRGVLARMAPRGRSGHSPCSAPRRLGAVIPGLIARGHLRHRLKPRQVKTSLGFPPGVSSWFSSPSGAGFMMGLPVVGAGKWLRREMPRPGPPFPPTTEGPAMAARAFSRWSLVSP